MLKSNQWTFNSKNGFLSLTYGHDIKCQEMKKTFIDLKNVNALAMMNDGEVKTHLFSIGFNIGAAWIRDSILEDLNRGININDIILKLESTKPGVEL